MKDSNYIIIDETQWCAPHAERVNKEKNNSIDLKVSNHDDKIESELPPEYGKISYSSQSISKDNTGRPLELTLDSGNGELKKVENGKDTMPGFPVSESPLHDKKTTCCVSLYPL